MIEIDRSKILFRLYVHLIGTLQKREYNRVNAFDRVCRVVELIHKTRKKIQIPRGMVLVRQKKYTL